jgi:nitrogen regulatory protein PII
MANQAAYLGVQAGVPVILPSSYEGSPRNMRERCNDAMSIFGKFGSMDLFVTVTANPNWPEIAENLRPGEATSDRPDLVARVFKLKLKAIIEDLTKHSVLGKCVAYVYTIEFQKRGLPHAHILIVVKDEDKYKTSNAIDRMVSAEIPDIHTEPRLFEIVSRCMMHGPCGTDNPHAPCMEDHICKKNFPKKFQDATLANVDGYPLYRRRQGQTTFVRGVEMDNRYVVPYNKYLLLKYNCHINVEVSTSQKAVKYIYKYIYK